MGNFPTTFGENWTAFFGRKKPAKIIWSPGNEKAPFSLNSKTFCKRFFYDSKKNPNLQRVSLCNLKKR